MMNIKELVNSLNDKQLAYVNMDLPDPKNGEYLLFDSKTVNINQYGSEMYRASQFIQNIKDLGLTIFIFCILLYGFLNFRSTGKNY